MGRCKNDKAKLREGRCQGHGAEYIPWIKSNEAKSKATATIIKDPVCGRAVHTLSKGEEAVFWEFRFNPEVKEIREQYALFDLDAVARISKSVDYKTPRNILSTDFLVDYFDGSSLAISVKWNRDEFDPLKNPKEYKEITKRQYLEKRYWEEKGIKYQLIFSGDLNPQISKNISTVMLYYDKQSVRDDFSLFMHLIAHHAIEIPMNQSLDFRGIFNQKEYKKNFIEVKTKYGK